jgi:hypothetical protein
VDEKLPEAVTALLSTRVDSFEKLEVVVALHKAPGSTMTVGELCSALELPRDAIKEVAVELRAAALCELASNDQIRLAPATEQERAAVAELVKLHAEDRFSIVKALGQLAVERIRNMASRTFAAAFVIRKNGKRGDDG